MAEVRILYIATADGLVQLANPGKSDRWREIGRALQGQELRAVAASPADPLLAYSGGSAGIDRTVDGGAGWERVAQTPVSALWFDDNGRIVAETEQGGMLVSVDGQAWSDAGTPVATAPHVTLELPAEATGTLLELSGSPPSLLLSTHAALLRSEDHGATLAPVDGPLDVTALVAAQRAVDQVFAGTSAGQLWYSSDRGRTWTQVASGYARVNSLAFARAL